MEVRQIRVGIGLDASHPQGQAVLKFAQLVGERSGGKIAVSLHANGTLGNDVSMIRDLQSGKLDMAVPDTATLVHYSRGFGVLNFPFLFNSEEDADALLDGEFGQSLLNSLKDKGLVGLGFWENGFRSVTNSVKSIDRTADMHGLRMRVMQNPMFIDTFAALGATPVPMAFPEVYGALKSGAIDGQENPFTTIQNSKFSSVQKYLTLTRHSYSAWVLLMSGSLWDKLSPAERDIVREAAVEARTFERKAIRAGNEMILDALRKSGMNINELSSVERSRLRLLVRPVIEKFKQDFGRDWTDAMYIALARNEMKKIMGTR